MINIHLLTFVRAEKGDISKFYIFETQLQSFVNLCP